MNYGHHEAYMSVGKASFVVGGQFGSEAKGLVASYIADVINWTYQGIMVSTTNAGAQAGHTTVRQDGTKFVCYHLPTVGVLVKPSHIHLNAGSIIDLKMLEAEVRDVSHALNVTEESIWSRLSIHPHATVITEEAKTAEREGATTHLGSTQKGVGAALARKIMRDPYAVYVYHSLEFMEQIKRRVSLIGSPNLNDRTVMVEVPQGTGLSLNSSGFYPKVTSRECWIGQAMTDACIHPSQLGTVNMVVRTFPIRVGHIYDGQGNLLGHSGPFYGDGEEVSWNFLSGVTPERTTVTQRIRRIARWSREQYRHGLTMNRPNNVFLTFTNYCTRVELSQIVQWMRDDERIQGLYSVKHFYSWGPRTDHITEDLEEALTYCTTTR